MRLAERIHVAAPPAAVWELIADPTQYLDFMSGVTRWEVVSDEAAGVGARYRILMRIGSAEIGGLIEVVEWDEPCEIAWTSVTGLDQRGRWRVRAQSDTLTRVELRLAYGVAGSGIAGWIAEQVAAPMVSANLRRSLRAVKRMVEQEQLRRRTAARRAARVG
jgi:carbon monoxide dehydrogenase subunit G